MSDYQEFLLAAREAAAAAATVIHQGYGGAAVNYKDDGSPVTQVDIDAEHAVRGYLMQRFPGHGFYGEELGARSVDAEFLWLIDPIDGTKSFVRGYPLFSTQIALMHRGEIVVAVSSAPLYNEIAWASKAGGAFLNHRRIEVAAPRELSLATLSIGNIQTLTTDPQAWLRVGELLASAHRHRGYGDFLHYHLLASGRIDAVLESDVNVLDVAALSLIVSEAGGVMSDLDGAAIGLSTTSVAAASCTALQQRLLGLR